jgi:hypothetical protein
MVFCRADDLYTLAVLLSLSGTVVAAKRIATKSIYRPFVHAHTAILVLSLGYYLAYHIEMLEVNPRVFGLMLSVMALGTFMVMVQVMPGRSDFMAWVRTHILPAYMHYVLGAGSFIAVYAQWAHLSVDAYQVSLVGSLGAIPLMGISFWIIIAETRKARQRHGGRT